MNNTTFQGTLAVQFVPQTVSSKILMTTLFALVELVGILGNLLVIISIARERRLKSNYYFLVMILAVCDLALLLCSSVDNTARPWIAGWTITSNIVICKIWAPLMLCVYIVETHLLCFIAVLRYLAVCRPIQPALPRRKVKLHVSLIFVLSTVLVIPHVWARNLQNGICSTTQLDWFPFDIYRIALVIYPFLLPMVLLGILYVKICRGLIQHHHELNNFSTTTSNGNEHSAARQARNTRVSIVSIIIVVVFVTSSLPSTIGLSLWAFTDAIKYSQLQWMWLLYFAGVSAVNPIIYGLRDKPLLLGYKRSLKRFLTCLKEPRSSDIVELRTPVNTSSDSRVL